MRKWFNEVGKLKCHSILLHNTRKSRISVKVISSPKQTADKDYLLLAAWKNVNSFLTVKMIFRTLGAIIFEWRGQQQWVANAFVWPENAFSPQSIVCNRVFNRSQHNFTCSTRSVQHCACITCSHSLSAICSRLLWWICLAFRLFEISRSYDQVWRVSRSGSRWQGSDWTLIRSWLAILRRRRSRSATETRPSCRQD